MNEKEALLLGIILGDGCIGVYDNNHQYKIQITGHATDDKEFLLNVVKPLLKEIFNKNFRVSERRRCKAIDLIAYSKEIFDIINKKWGVEFGKGKKVFIAEQFVSNPNIMKKIISGFFATDGSLVITNNNGVWYPRLEFQNTSYTILKQIRKFLASLGIKGGFYKMKRNKSISFGKKIYRLQYNGVKNLLNFRKEIGFINPKHQLKFCEFKLEMLG